MPNVGLTDAQAVSIAELLLTPPPPDTTKQRPSLLQRLSPRRRLQLALVLGVTFAAGAAAGGVGTWLARRQ
jgi:hypothetical protein